MSFSTLTEAGDVQDSDEVCRGVEGEALVDSGDDVVEESAVDGFGQSVSSVVGLLHLQRHSEENTDGKGIKVCWESG